MMARSHVVVGAAAWVAAAPLLHLPTFELNTLCLAVAGALLPDLDHPGSWVGRRARPLSTVLAATLGHRGVTHSALAVVAIVLLLVHFGQHRAAVSALAVGYLSHLAADMLTPRGLRLAWPLRCSWGVPLCRTGSPAEPLIVMVVAFGALWRVLARWHF